MQSGPKRVRKPDTGTSPASCGKLSAKRYRPGAFRLYPLNTKGRAVQALRLHSADFDITLPHRERQAIERSRNTASRDYGFSKEKNADILAFARATGLRRHELAAIRPEQIRMNPDGSVALCGVTGKGGKVRDIAVLPGKEEAVLKFAGNPTGKPIFTSVPSHMDVHGCRRAYANVLYRQLARSLHTLARQEKYYCKKDRRGMVYDRRAMLQVSRQLGTTCISAIAGHYLD
ncbi:MAG: hypothetical protein ACLR23_21890 [Clostridia bacterium]